VEVILYSTTNSRLKKNFNKNFSQKIQKKFKKSSSATCPAALSDADETMVPHEPSALHPEKSSG
jgi:hypothetical protein